MRKAKRERSVRIFDADDLMPPRPSPADFMQFYPWACAELGCPAAPALRRQLRDEYFTGKSSDKGKSSRGKKGRGGGGSAEEAEARAGGGGGGDESGSGAPASAEGERGASVPVVAVYDAQEQLVEVAFVSGAPVPRVMLQVLALCVPLAPHLSTLRVRGGGLDSYSLHEVRKFLAASALTDVCLDDSPLPEANYHLLLEQRSRLRRLSLARCALGDAGLEPLARRLHREQPAAAHLRLLDLASNALTDAGAALLAAALRSNRTLRYLNLSGNRITDLGCFALLDSLAEFPLTCDEILGARRRRLERARLRLAAPAAPERAGDEPGGAGAASKRGKPARGGKSASSLKRGRRAGEGGGEVSSAALGAAEAAEAAAGTGEEGDEPFSYEETSCHAGYVHCAGNAALAYLNLAYNEIEYPSVARVLATLRGQHARRGGGGLVRLVLEGNRLPPASAALEAAAERSLAGDRDPFAAAADAAAAARRKGKTAK